MTQQFTLAVSAILLLMPPLNLTAPGQTADDPRQVPVFEERPLFRASDAGYHCYRIPALLVTKQGTVLAFAEARKNSGDDHGDIDLVLKRSTDAGRTWSEQQLVADDGAQTMGNPCPVQDRETGIIWLPLCRNNKRVLLMHSTDEGKSWSQPTDITAQASKPTWHWVGTGPGHGIQLKSGRLLIPCWADTTPTLGETQLSFAFFSDDHGKNWQCGEPLDANTSDECEAVELTDGMIYMNARSRQNQRKRAMAVSQNGGKSWLPVTFDDRLPEPSCQGSIIRLTEGVGSGKNRILLATPSNPNARRHMKIFLSYDECRSWPISKIVDEGSSAYSDLAVTSSGEGLLLYEADDYTLLRLIRFNLSWLTDGKDQLEVRTNETEEDRGAVHFREKTGNAGQLSPKDAHDSLTYLCHYPGSSRLRMTYPCYPLILGEFSHPLICPVKWSKPNSLAMVSRAGEAQPVAQEPASRSEGTSTIVTVSSSTPELPRKSEGDVIELTDGRLLLVSMEFGGDGSDFATTRFVSHESSDGGRTWGRHRVITETLKGDLNVYSPNLIRAKDGGILLLFMRQHRPGSLTNHVWKSSDEGQTFSPLSEFVPKRDFALCNATVKRLASGRLLLPANPPAPGKLAETGPYAATMLYSDDDGLTWQVSESRIELPMRGAMEPHVEQTADGRVLMVMRNQLGKLHFSASTDDGATWSPAFASSLTAPESCPELTRIPGTSDLLMIWNNAYDPKFRSHFGKRSPLTAAISSDQGKTWQHVRDIETDPTRAFSNPGCRFTRDGRAIINYWTCEYLPNWAMQDVIDLRVAVIDKSWFYGEPASNAEAKDDQ